MAHHRYNLQIEVINQLGQRIENQLRSQESRLTALPRNEASSLWTTHVKLTRDYRLVEQQFKNVQLDVKRKRGLAEARQREAARMEEEEKERKRRAGGAGGEDMTEEGMRWQMQIQEDVSRGDTIDTYCLQCMPTKCFSNLSRKSMRKLCENVKKKLETSIKECIR